MPDWSYQTVFRPLLFRLPYSVARDVCLGFMGGLARLPLGGAIIDFLGHMRPDARLETNVAGVELASPVILGPWLDVKLAAPQALGRFGFGAITIGPAAATVSGNLQNIRGDARSGSLRLVDPLPVMAADDAAARLARSKPALPVIVRLHAERGQSAAEYSAECAASIAKLAPQAAFVALDVDDATASNWSLPEWQQHVESVIRTAVTPRGPLPVLVCLRADAGELQHLFASTALAAGAGGIIVDGLVRESYDGDWLVGGACLNAVAATVERLRREIPADVPIIAGGAVDPRSTLDLLAAGANAVQIDAGLVYAGPGLAKRINEAVWFARFDDEGRTGGSTVFCGAKHRHPATRPPLRGGALRGFADTATSGRGFEHAGAMSWFSALLLGVAMTLGGLMAMWFASTRVLLPYDEAYLGMTAEELSARVPRLLEFMAHDRVTLAGTMLAVGIQYVFLAWCGIRQGEHWAKMTVVASAFAGFLSFFLFLGFGYFDPLHAFVTAILFQFLLLAFQGRLGAAQPPLFPNLVSDWRWQLANWGQLLLVAQGVAVFTAGVTIATVGITTVFVPEDLEFMGTTAEAIRAVNPRLVPVVAHDRASFGGMLISVGLATLLPALWGIRQGARWVWWMLAIAGTVGYGPTLTVHLHVGYTDPMHLAPALGGLAMLWVALGLLYPQLVGRNVEHEVAWRKLLEALNRRKHCLR